MLFLGSAEFQSSLHIFSSKSQKPLTFRRNCNIHVCGQTLVLVLTEEKHCSSVT